MQSGAAGQALGMTGLQRREGLLMHPGEGARLSLSPFTPLKIRGAGGVMK
jgi:hypothetical protein